MVMRLFIDQNTKSITGLFSMVVMLVLFMSFHAMQLPDSANGNQNGPIPGRAGWSHFASYMIADLGMCMSAGFNRTMHWIDFCPDRQIDCRTDNRLAQTREDRAFSKLW
ncbi:hypothetical protein D9M70_586870 [compost metagenome]